MIGRDIGRHFRCTAISGLTTANCDQANADGACCATRLPSRTGSAAQPFGSRRRTRKALSYLHAAPAAAFLFCFFLPSCGPAVAQNLTLATAAGGMLITGSGKSFNGGFGAVNGLGIGSPSFGISVTTVGVTGGALYTSPYNLTVAGAGLRNTAVIKAYVSSNFVNNSVNLDLESCQAQVDCSSASSFTMLPSSQAAEIDVIPIPGVQNGTFTADLGLFVNNQNGPSAQTGLDTAAITFDTYSYNGTTLRLQASDTLTFNIPPERLQTAVQLQLATAPGGATISPGSDYSLTFGSSGVNGLGIDPGSGFGIIRIGTAGAIYTTPYLINPAFSSFSSTTGSVTVYVSVNFANPSTLQLQDSADNATYAAISTSSATQTNITSSAQSAVSITRYLGVFVGSTNGAGAFTGVDTAQLTFTLTVP